MQRAEKADRLKKLPPYLFKELDRQRDEVRKRGMDIIDLGVGDPDLPTPNHIIKRLCEAAHDPATHRYPAYSGMKAFNQAVARWYEKRFGVSLDPDSQVVTLIGSKEGIAHLPLAFVNPGDLALIPDPAYPVYRNGTIFAGGEPVLMPLLEKNGFLPDLASISPDHARKARILFLNYPNNPTSATAELEFFREVTAFARTYDLIVCHDNAYSEMGFDGYRAPSFLQAEGAGEVGIEFHSLSKTYNMTGWRIGFAVGNADVIQALGVVKSNIDSGAFDAIQYAGIEALEGDQRCASEIIEVYRERRDILVHGLREAGLPVLPPKATFYLWVRVPEGFTSSDFSTLLLTRTGIVTTPGNGFGPSGEGYVRICLCVNKERLREAVQRIRTLDLTRKPLHGKGSQ